MDLKDTYPGEVIHWGGEYWTPISSTELAPLAIMYKSLVNRSQYVEAGLRHERRYLTSVTPGMRRKSSGLGQNETDSWINLRLQTWRGELEARVPYVFDSKYDELVEYASEFNIGTLDS